MKRETNMTEPLTLESLAARVAALETQITDTLTKMTTLSQSTFDIASEDHDIAKRVLTRLDTIMQADDAPYDATKAN
jgi:hypothetical protein